MSSSTGASDKAAKEAAELFESFLAQYYEGGTTLDDLCCAHPNHAEPFRRWWDNLLRAGEVSDLSSTELEAELPVEGRNFGSYKLEREIGRGSQGTVFLAEDTRLSRRVAVKILPAYRAGGRANKRRFAREAELASRLDHPGLCTVYERGMTDGHAFLAMRYIEGETLTSILARARRQAEGSGQERAVRLPRRPHDEGIELAERVAIERILAMFEDIAGALQAAHDVNLIHRDVKSSNIVVDHKCHPVLLDFGLARETESEALTMTGDLIGTPAYLSPEQLAADRIVLDHRTDIYSLGVTLYECLTLHRPFEAPTQSALYQQILSHEPRNPRELNPDVPPELATVLLTTLDKNRDRRYQTASDLAEDLRRVRRREPILAKPAGALLRLRRFAERNPTVATVSLLFILAAVTALIVAMQLFTEMRRSRDLFDKLADGVRLEAAQSAARQLQPFRAHEAASLRWLEELGQPLVDARPGHQAELLALRARALPSSEEQRARDRAAHPDSELIAQLRLDLAAYVGASELVMRPWRRRLVLWQADQLTLEIDTVTRRLREHRVWRFARAEDRIANEALARLVADLEKFQKVGAYARMREDQVWAVGAKRRIRTSEGLWQRLRERIRRSPHYGGRDLPPQSGLVPLGDDPRTGLFEFALARSGSIPARDPKSKALQLDEHSCMVLVLLPPGAFDMGVTTRRAAQLGRTPSGARTRRTRVFERFSIPITMSWFFIGKHEVSRGQWQRLGGRSGVDALLASHGSATAGHPVESVSWNESVACLARHGLELPTIAQWEYAARAGRDNIYSWGNTRRPPVRPPACNLADSSYANAMSGRVEATAFADGFALTAPVWSCRPNEFGLQNFGGNVREWCQEPFIPMRLDAFELDPAKPEFRLPRHRNRAVRGGAYNTLPKESFLGRRDGRTAALRHSGVGLRVARRVD